MSYRRSRPLLEAAEMPTGTLARFARPLTWPQILALDPKTRELWWTYAIGNAEDRKLLRWLPRHEAWVLTEAGRAAVREVA